MANLKVIFLVLFYSCHLSAQSFYFGADMSYVNELEDCGVQYYEHQVEKDPYSIFEDYGCNLVRLRLWHTPSWYDELNEGKRYSDLADVKLAISRAKQHNLAVLLDFHLSDNWADPGKQLVPLAWLPVVDDTDLLKDALYQYIFETLSDLNSDDLLPEMIQIGNETNKGILLSPTDNEVWTLDWERNAILFNEAIKAVEDFEEASKKHIKIVIHVAAPAEAEWLIESFLANGVTNFDIIGLSYYWSWHQPTSIADAANVIQKLKTKYPNKEVLVVETGYIWTNDSNDSANNIISDSHPDYQPVNPENQRDWLIDLAQEVVNSDGLGVIYWEPAWVSSDCYTQWGQGSHQEHATFFDFDNNLLLPGGIEWMSYDYGLNPVSTIEPRPIEEIKIFYDSLAQTVNIRQPIENPKKMSYAVVDTSGKILKADRFSTSEVSLSFSSVPFGIYVISVKHRGTTIKSTKILHKRGK